MADEILTLDKHLDQIFSFIAVQRGFILSWILLWEIIMGLSPFVSAKFANA